MRKGCIALLLAGCLLFASGLSACGGQSSGDSGSASSGATEQKVEAPKLDGRWIQEGHADGEDGMMGAIDGDAIALWIHSGNTNMDYWVGSFEPPTSDADYTFTSKANRPLMKGLFCSQDNEKEFKVSGGKISFDFTMRGQTTNIVMEQLSNETGILSDILDAQKKKEESLANRQDLKLVDSGYVLSRGYVEYAIAIENPNKDLGAKSVHVNIVGRKQDGSIRFSDDWSVTEVAPGATTYWASQAGSGDVEESDTIEFKVSVEDDNWYPSEQKGDYYKIDNVSTGPAGGYSKALKTTGEITLKEDVALDSGKSAAAPMVVCVLKDADGKIITGYSTFVGGVGGTPLKAGESQAFEVSSMFEAVDYASADVYANPWL